MGGDPFKDKRLPENEREPAFIQAFCSAGPEVHIIKLADLYDNNQDSRHLPASKQRTSLVRWKAYLDGLGPHMTAATRPAFDIVSRLFNETMAEPRTK